MTKKILYLLWGEDVSHHNGIFLSQVLSQLEKTKALYSDIEIRCLAGIPILKKRILFRWKDYSTELKRLRVLFSEKGLLLSFRHIPIFSRFNSKKNYFHFYSLMQKGFLKRMILKNDINIVHCRSYHSTYLSLKTREKYNLDVKIIFDARGIVPEEGVIKRIYSIDSRHYQFWKKVEKENISKSDVVVTVSKPFSEYFETFNLNNRIYTIPTSCDTDVFTKLPNRKTVRDGYGITDETKVLVYSGSIGKNRWHTPEGLVAVYKEFRKAFKHTLLFIVTKIEIEDEVLSIFSQEKIGKSELRVEGSETLDKTNKLLNIADYSVIPFRSPKHTNSNIKKRIGEIMISSKTGEYLSVGLPIIVNKAVGGASRIVEEEEVGVSYVHDNIGKLVQDLHEMDKEYEIISKRCVKAAFEHFSTLKHAQQYYEIYKNLST